MHVSIVDASTAQILNSFPLGESPCSNYSGHLGKEFYTSFTSTSGFVFLNHNSFDDSEDRIDVYSANTGELVLSRPHSNFPGSSVYSLIEGFSGPNGLYISTTSWVNGWGHHLVKFEFK